MREFVSLFFTVPMYVTCFGGNYPLTPDQGGRATTAQVGDEVVQAPGGGVVRMAPRDTRTGSVLEQMILPALRMGGYGCQTQVLIGRRPGGRRHVVDVLATDRGGNRFLVSLKWQQVSGTAEQKVPFEAICLAEAIRTGEGKYHKAYLVLGGGGWSLRDFYVGGGLDGHLRYSTLVNIITLETFIGLANQGKL